MKKIIFLVSMSFLILLSGCGAVGETEQYQQYLIKPMRLSEPRYLVFVKHWSPMVGDLYLVARLPEKTSHTGTTRIPAVLPSLNDYRANPGKWKQFQGDFTAGWVSVLTILPKGTRYHIVYMEGPNAYGRGMVVTIEIDEGKYKGTRASYHTN